MTAANHSSIWEFTSPEETYHEISKNPALNRWKSHLSSQTLLSAIFEAWIGIAIFGRMRGPLEILGVLPQRKEPGDADKISAGLMCRNRLTYSCRGGGDFVSRVTVQHLGINDYLYPWQVSEFQWRKSLVTASPTGLTRDILQLANCVVQERSVAILSLRIKMACSQSNEELYIRTIFPCQFLQC